MNTFPLFSSSFTSEHSKIVLLLQSHWGVNWQRCGSRQVSCPANVLWGTQTSAWNSSWLMFGIRKKEQSMTLSLSWSCHVSNVFLWEVIPDEGYWEINEDFAGSFVTNTGSTAASATPEFAPKARRGCWARMPEKSTFSRRYCLRLSRSFCWIFLDWLLRPVHHVRPFRCSSAWQFWLAQDSAYTSFILLFALKVSSHKISACLPWSFAGSSGCSLLDFANRRRSKAPWSKAVDNLLKLLLTKNAKVCFFFFRLQPSDTLQGPAPPGKPQCCPAASAAIPGGLLPFCSIRRLQVSWR